MTKTPPEKAPGDRLDRLLDYVAMDPSNLALLADAADAFPVEVLVAEELGSEAFLYGTLEGAMLRDPQLVAKVAPRSVPEKGSRVHFRILPERLHAFSPETGEALPKG